jgi:hypothetical protein
MGCGGVNVKVLPVAVQKAIKQKQNNDIFLLSLKQFDQNYDWLEDTCRELKGSVLKTLTLNFDSKEELTGYLFLMIFLDQAEETVTNILKDMLLTLNLQCLILVGKLQIFNNSQWKSYWETCNVQVFIITIYRLYQYKID